MRSGKLMNYGQEFRETIKIITQMHKLTIDLNRYRLQTINCMESQS